MGGKKNHPTLMREIRDLEKRLRKLETEHNNLSRLRSLYGKSASNTRPYLAERIAASFRPQTAPEPRLVKRRVLKQEPNDEKGSSLSDDSSIIVPREKESWGEEVTSFGKVDGLNSRRFQNVQFETRKTNEDPNFELHNGRFRVEKHRCRSVSGLKREPAPGTTRKTSSKASRHGARSARSANSRSSCGSRAIATPENKGWIYRSMPLLAERQSIYTMTAPPVRIAEESRKGSSKKRFAKDASTRRRVPRTDLHLGHEHVVRFQGNPRNLNNGVHRNENVEKAEYVFKELEHCRYLRMPGFSAKRLP